MALNSPFKPHGRTHRPASRCAITTHFSLGPARTFVAASKRSPFSPHCEDGLTSGAAMLAGVAQLDSRSKAVAASRICHICKQSKHSAIGREKVSRTKRVFSYRH